MITPMSGGEGLSSAASLYFAQQAQGVNGLSPLIALTGGEGGGGQTSASISGPGQLLSNLQQLQAQDPTKFQQVVSQIASQIQSAAGQTQGPESDFLTNLAAKFQNVAAGGSLSQLQPQRHHHHHHAQQSYGQGAPTNSQGVAGLAQANGSQSSSGSDLQQLFATISSEVSAALGK